MDRHALRRSLARSAFAPLALSALALAACGREPTGVGATGHATLVFAPSFQTTGTGQADDNVTSIRVTVYAISPGPDSSSASRRKELRTFRFDSLARQVTETNDAVTLTISFPLVGDGSTYEIEGGAYSASGVLLYATQPVKLTEKQLAVVGGAKVETAAKYVGPGSNATRVQITPRTLAVAQGQQGQFAATVYAGTTVLASAVLRWTSLNSVVASFISERGGTIRGNAQGSARVVVMVEGTTAADTAVVNVSLTPTGLVIVSGGGQSGAPGTQLSQPVIVRLMAGTTPVSGVAVTFAPGSGGSVSAPSVVTDANGNAQTNWTLGTATGSQLLTVGSSGVPSLTVTATAVSLVKTVSFVSLTPSAVTVGDSSIVLVQVTDAAGLPVAGETVAFSASGGSGISLVPASAVTNVSGQARTVFSSADTGTKTLTATIGGASAQAKIPVTATNASLSATQLVKISGDAQTVQIGKTFGSPIVVEARNAAGNPVAGAFVDFGTLLGTARQVTGSDGRASVLYTVSPLATPGTGTIEVTLFPNATVKVVFTYVAVP